jgi:hypothetical protein
LYTEAALLATQRAAETEMCTLFDWDTNLTNELSTSLAAAAEASADASADFKANARVLPFLNFFDFGAKGSAVAEAMAGGKLGFDNQMDTNLEHSLNFQMPC